MTRPTTARQLDAENPWPGLDAFDESEQAFFHGRDDDTKDLLHSVLDSPIVVLYGRSGLGKTSLLQAAVFPALREKHHLPVYVRLDFTTDALPIADQLRVTLRQTLQAEVPDAALPGDDESVWEYLHRGDVEWWSDRNFPLTPVLVIDQFEEVFTLGSSAVDECRNDLGDLIENRIPADLAARLRDVSQLTDPMEEEGLTGLALRSRRYKLLISIREDFLADLEEWRPLIPLLARPRYYSSTSS